MKSNDDLIILAFVIGIPLYLLMAHPFIFWLVFIPFIAVLIIKFITWLKK